jgi:hypothetical protein
MNEDLKETLKEIERIQNSGRGFNIICFSIGMFCLLMALVNAIR